jgi:hypothetical protein
VNAERVLWPDEKAELDNRRMSVDEACADRSFAGQRKRRIVDFGGRSLCLGNEP